MTLYVRNAPGLRNLAVLLAALALLCCLSACSPKHLIVQGMASELAVQNQAPEEDLILAREASAFYLKFSEALLREVPENGPLAESVAAGFTQYAYAFVAFEADRIEATDTHAAQRLRQRAARLYARAQRHAMAALDKSQPGFRTALQSSDPALWPVLRLENVGLAYWGAASWGGLISLSKDDPDTVADFPLTVRLASLAYDKNPAYGEGSLASLMGTMEAARAGGSRARALAYFDQAIDLGQQHSAGPLVAKAEGYSLPQGDRAQFEELLHQAVAVAGSDPTLQNAVMRERALWLLGIANELF